MSWKIIVKCQFKSGTNFGHEVASFLAIFFYRRKKVPLLLQVSEDTSLFLLPPANEVWSKVMFIHRSVILFTGGGVYPLPEMATEAGGTHPTGMHSCKLVMSMVSS